MNTIQQTGFAISARGVQKKFGAVVAAADIDLDIPHGQKLSLIGSNGAGKTTFVNMITGFIKPDAGSILLHDENITGLEPRRQRVHAVAAREIERGPGDGPALAVGADIVEAQEDFCDQLVGGDAEFELCAAG